MTKPQIIIIKGGLRGKTGPAGPAGGLFPSAVFTSAYSDIFGVQLNSADVLTGWSGSGLQTACALDTVNKVEGTASVKAVVWANTTASAMWVTLGAAQPTAGYDFVSVAVQWAKTGPTDWTLTVDQVYRLVIADGVNLTGNRQTIPFPSIGQNGWAIARIPVGTLANVRSIGVEKYGISTGGSGGNRAFIWMDNVRFADETPLDQAEVRSAAGKTIIVASDYTSGVAQQPLFLPADKELVDFRVNRSFLSRAGGVRSLREFYIPDDGSADASAALSSVFASLLPNSELRMSPDTLLRLDSQVVLRNLQDVVIDGQGARMWTTNGPTALFSLAQLKNVTFRNFSSFGHRSSTYNGSTLKNVGGAPVTVGTTKTIAAQADIVQLPDNGNGLAFAWARDENLDNSFVFTLSDNNHVAGDCVLKAINDETGAVVASLTLTLTAVPTAYTFAFRPNFLGRLRIQVTKATATANAITVASAVANGGVFYNAAWDGAAMMRFDDVCQRVYFENLLLEGAAGDAIQQSIAGVDGVRIRNCWSRAANRQGYSFNRGDNFVCESSRISAPGRSGIDIESSDVTWVTNHAVLRDLEFDNITNVALALSNWANIKDLTVDNITVHSTAGGSFQGGARGARISGITSENATADQDCIFVGQNMEVDGIEAYRGVGLIGGSMVVDEGSGPVTYAGGGNSFRGKVQVPGRYTELTVAPGSGWTVRGMGTQDAITTGFQIPTNVGPFQMPNDASYQALDPGVHRRMWPNTYRGLASRPLWHPSGLDLVSEPVYGLRSLGGEGAILTLLASAVRTTSGTSAVTDLFTTSGRLDCRLRATSITGTAPTCIVTLETSPDNANWRPLAAFPTLIALGQAGASLGGGVVSVPSRDRYVRVSWVIAGTTPSFTFFVEATSTLPGHNLRGIALAVPAGATSLAVAFPASPMPNPGSFSLNADATVGQLTPSTPYYYRVAARGRRRGPILALAEKTITTGAGATSLGVWMANCADTMTQIAGFTIYRGTAPGVYTARYDLVPSEDFFAYRVDSFQLTDKGSSLVVPLGARVYGYPASIYPQAGSFAPADESGWEPDANYMVTPETNWNSGVPYVTAKTPAGFTLNFPNAAPGDGSGRVSWLLVR